VRVHSRREQEALCLEQAQNREPSGKCRIGAADFPTGSDFINRQLLAAHPAMEPNVTHNFNLVLSAGPVARKRKFPSRGDSRIALQKPFRFQQQPQPFAVFVFQKMFDMRDMADGGTEVGLIAFQLR